MGAQVILSPWGLAGRWEPGAQFGFLQAHSKGCLDFWKGFPPS